MTIKKLMLAAAALSMTASPVLAANPAAPLSVAPKARAAAPKGDSALLGGGAFVAIIAAIAVIIGIIIVANEDDSPHSP